MPSVKTSMFSGRRLRLPHGTMLLSDDTYIVQGGEAEIHKVSDGDAAKLYKDETRARALQSKISILCAKAHHLPESVVVPQHMLFWDEPGPPHFAGFVMRFLADAKPVGDYGWHPGVPAGDEDALDRGIAALLFDLCNGIKGLHRNRVIVSDLKPANMLVSSGTAWLVDIDSASLTPDHMGDVFTADYLDPRLQGPLGDARGSYTFDPEGDWWALSVIAFTLFLGVLPWHGRHDQLRTKGMRRVHQSVIGFDKEVALPTGGRMRGMKWFDDKPRLRDFFCHIFSDDLSARHSIEFALEATFARPEGSHRNACRPPITNNLIHPEIDHAFYKQIWDTIDGRVRPQLRATREAEQRFLRLMLECVAG